MDSALLSFFMQDKDLVTDNRPLRLRLAHPTQMLEDVLLPQHVQGTESICGSLEYRILCVSLDAFIPLKELIALPVAVDIVTDRGDLRSICGIVTEARAGDSDGGLASYQLVMRDALSIMEKRTNTRVFRNRNEMEIVEIILDEWRTTNPIIGTCFRYEKDELFGHQKYPQREFTMQYNESDAAFIRRMLKRRGIAWYFRADQSKFPSHTMVLFNHPHSLKPNAAGVVRYHRDDATEERDSITSWCAVRTLQPSSVTRFSWDYKRPHTAGIMFTTSQGRADQGEAGNQLAASLDDYQILSPHAGDNYDDLCELGQLAVNRHDLESKCFSGEGSVRDMCVGEYFTLEGHPEIDGHPKCDRDFVTTSMQIEISNNLNGTLAQRVRRLFLSHGWVTCLENETNVGVNRLSVMVKFTVVRRGISIVPAWDTVKQNQNVPMQSAIVVGPGDEAIYCDELGRVKIRFRTTRARDHSHAQGAGAVDNDMDSAWVRVASNWAGDGPASLYQAGNLHLPRVGSEVLISFLGGDPDKPIIVGQLFNQVSPPPALSDAGGLPGNRYLSGLRSSEINGSRANRLVFDDTQGEISTQLGSDHGGSMFRAGYLTSPREHGSGDRRGEGIELITTLQAALRSAQGMLISTRRHFDALGPHMAIDEFRQLVLVCRSLVGELSTLAEASQADGADGTSIDNFDQAISSWGAGDVTPSGPIAIEAADGLGLATPQGICNYAGQNFDVVASGNVQATAGGKLVLNAAESISVFAEKHGFKAIAGGGPLVLQSQGEDVEVHAAKGIRLTANDGPISCTAKEIHLTAADGSFVKIGNGITFGCNGTIKFHGANFEFKKPKTMHAKFGGINKKRELKRDLIVELIDADGESPDGEQLRLEFSSSGEIKTATVNAGRVKLTGLPRGQFKLVQPRRR